MWVPDNPHEWIPSTTVRQSVVNTSACSCHALPKTITLVLTPILCTFSQKVLSYLKEKLHKILSLKLFCCFWYQHRQEAVKMLPEKKTRVFTELCRPMRKKMNSNKPWNASQTPETCQLLCFLSGTLSWNDLKGRPVSEHTWHQVFNAHSTGK